MEKKLIYVFCVWDTLKMMLFTKYLIEWKRIGRIWWKLWFWFNLQSSLQLDMKRQMLYLSNTPLRLYLYYRSSLHSCTGQAILIFQKGRQSCLTQVTISIFAHQGATSPKSRIDKKISLLSGKVTQSNFKSRPIFLLITDLFSMGQKPSENHDS